MKSEERLYSMTVQHIDGQSIDFQKRISDILPDMKIRAREADRTAIFPFETIQTLAQYGALDSVLPRSQGGAECDLATAQALIGTIAQADPVAALVLVNHYMVHAELRSLPSYPVPLLDREATAGKLINALLAEPDQGSASRGGLPGTVARKTDQGWSLTGRKAYVTGIPALSWLLVRARTDAPEAEIAFFLIPQQASGITVLSTWDHVGMRASASQEVILTDVSVPDDHLIFKEKAGEPSTFGKVLAVWNQGLLAALYDGIVRTAVGWTEKFLKERKPSNLGASLATLPAMQNVIGEIQIALDLNQTLLRSFAEAVALKDQNRIQKESVLIKIQTVDGAAGLTQSLLAIAGNAGLSARNDLERCHRDALCGRIHAPHAELLRTKAGRQALGV
ncbi:acyl-CoA dehydrogenase family protein [Acetobacter indonesiensis]|uniref:acyl-CoA dehydrogenase family protein n=1 Tax=Acetobacter indonesiensis TaxID=104101 RepID=UPI0039EB601B